MTDSPSAIPPEVLLHHAAFLRALARGLLGDGQESDDVVQSTLVAALESPPPDASRPQAWLGSVARNLARKFARSQRRRGEREAAVARPEAVADASSEVEHADSLRAVTEAVLALGATYRALVLAHYFEGLELRTIAERTGEPLATVRSRHTRALAQLRERLDRAHGGRRASWAVGLLGLVGAERSVGLATGIGSGVAAGALIMSTQTKIVAALLAALALFALWFGLLRPAQPGGSAVAALAPTLIDAGDADASVATPAVATRAAPQPPARVAAAAPATLGSIRAQVQWSDGTPAAGVVVSYLPYDTASVYLQRERALSDAAGVVQFTDVRPGAGRLWGDRGGQVGVTVEAGSEQRVVLPIPVGLAVHGLVHDLEGRPVADAELWLSDYGNGNHSAVIATSGPDGRFQLRDVGDGRTLCARHPHHGPSPGLTVQGSPGADFELVLILQGRPAGLSVRVLDGQGRALPRARVQVSESTENRIYEGYPPNTPMQHSLAPARRTDPEGRVAFLDLAPGTAELTVQHPELAAEVIDVELIAGSTRELEVRLQQGFTVTGVVHDAEGHPAAGASLVADEPSRFVYTGTRTDAEGRFTLEHLPAGEQALHASLSPAGGRATTRLRGEHGEQLEWNPRLERGNVLRLRLVDDRGTALSDWRLNLREMEPPRPREQAFRASATSDAEGRFEVANCPSAPLRVNAYRPGDFSGGTRIEFEDVLADGIERELIVAEAIFTTASLRARTLLADGSPAAVSLRLRRADADPLERPDTTWGPEGWTDANTGELHFPSVTPGHYVLLARDGQGLALRPIEVVLLPGQALDLGDLRVGGPGRLLGELAPLPGVDGAVSFISLSTDMHHHVRMLTGEELQAGIELEAGRYLLEVYGKFLPESRAFEVGPDETTHLVVPLRPCVDLVLQHDLPAGTTLPLELQLVLRDAAGEEVWRCQGYLEDEPGMPPQFANVTMHSVPPAEGYLLEVTAGDLKGSVPIAAQDLHSVMTPGLKPVLVVLR